MTTIEGWYDAAREDGQLVLSIGGRWTNEAVKQLDMPLRRLPAFGRPDSTCRRWRNWIPPAPGH